MAVPEAVHSVGPAISRCRGMLADDETLGLLQVDLRNAFNAIDRKPILDFTHKYLPRAFPWVQWMLVSNVPLYCGNEVVNCSTGVQQGDPLGPMLFSPFNGFRRWLKSSWHTNWCRGVC